MAKKKIVKISKKTKRRAIAQKNLSGGRVYIQSTFNNTIVTLADAEGQVLAWNSAGKLGYTGARKATPYAASIVAKEVADKAKNLGIRQIKIYVSGIGTGRDSAVRALQSGDFDVLSIADITPIPHNGPRPKKPRRV